MKVLNNLDTLDNIADGETYKKVSSTEKSTWDGKVEEAPSDSKIYGRKNGNWAEISDGLHLIKLTQAQYDALQTKDNTALYVIVG